MVRSLLRQRLGTTGVKIAIFIARGWPARAMWDWGENSHFHRAGVARQGHVGLA